MNGKESAGHLELRLEAFWSLHPAPKAHIALGGIVRGPFRRQEGKRKGDVDFVGGAGGKACRTGG